MDTEVTTTRSSWEKTCDAHPGDAWCSHSTSTQEFIFGEWWRQGLNNCPDIIYQLGSATHDISRRNERGYRRSMIWMFDLISEFLDVSCPQTVYYYSMTPRVAETKVPLKYRAHTKNSIISRFNAIALEVFPSHPRMFKALDLYNFTSGLTDDSFLDAAHVKGEIYENIINRFMTLAFK